MICFDNLSTYSLQASTRVNFLVIQDRVITVDTIKKLHTIATLDLGNCLNLKLVLHLG